MQEERDQALQDAKPTQDGLSLPFTANLLLTTETSLQNLVTGLHDVPRPPEDVVPNFWLHQTSLDNRPMPCAMTGITSVLSYLNFQGHASLQIRFMEHPSYSEGPGAIDSIDHVIEIPVLRIVNMLFRSNDRTDTACKQLGHTAGPRNHRRWDYQRFPRRYLIILDHLYVVPPDLLTTELLHSNITPNCYTPF